MSGRLAVGMLLLCAIVAVGIFAVSQLNLSASAPPGNVETFLATRIKHFLVERVSRVGLPAESPDTQASITEGDTLFGVDCSLCHGSTGRQPTETGRWMSPRAPDLGSFEVQQYSNRELFWIVKNGVRLSGMPAFGSIETDDHIWDLVHFVRTLGISSHPS